MGFFPVDEAAELADAERGCSGVWAEWVDELLWAEMDLRGDRPRSFAPRWNSPAVMLPDGLAGL